SCDKGGSMTRRSGSDLTIFPAGVIPVPLSPNSLGDLSVPRRPRYRRGVAGPMPDQPALARISWGRMRLTEPEPPRPPQGGGPRADAAQAPVDRGSAPVGEALLSAVGGLEPGAAAAPPAAAARSRAARAAPDSQRLLPQRQHLRLDGPRR